MYVCDTRYDDNKIDKDKYMFCDIETHGLYLEVCLFQMYQSHWDEPVVVQYPDINWLREVVLSGYTVWYNAAYDLGTLEVAPKRFVDLFYAAKTAHPLLPSFTLDGVEEALGITDHDFISRIVEHQGISFESGMSKKDMQKSFSSAKTRKNRGFSKHQLAYAAADVTALERLFAKKRIRRVVRGNAAYAADVRSQKDALVYQFYGMKVNKGRLNRAIRSAKRHLRMHMKELPEGTNVKSPKLASWLGTQNANEQTLKGLILNGDTRAYHILEARKYRTRLQDLEKKYSGHDKIKTFFNAAGAITGRFTSTGGEREGYTNIQNINRDLKYIFGYDESDDRVMVNADYSTAELIAGCSIFKVPSMKKWIEDGLDIHRATAVGLAKTTYEKVTKQERQAAKAVNFGLLFGMGVALFREYAYYTYGVSFTEDEAQEAKNYYYRTHPGIQRHHRYIGEMCKNPDFTVRTALGRVAGNRRYTELLNIPVQGSIAEATKLSISHMIDNNKSLLKENKIVNMVHDSIVGDVRKEDVEEWAEAVNKAMQFGWREVSKSDIFTYKDLPMGVEVGASHKYDASDFYLKEFKR